MATRKIFVKVRINPGLWVMPCPVCGYYCASACERSLLPVWTCCPYCK